MARPLVRALGAALVAALTIAPLLPSTDARAAIDPPRSARFLVQTDGRLLSVQQIERTAAALDVTRVRPLADGFAAVSAVLGDGGAGRTRTALAAVPGVVEVARDERTALAGTPAPVKPGDRYFTQQWDLWDATSERRAGGSGVDAPRAWTRTLGSPDVVVAVLDSGITDHPDLAGASVAPGRDFVTGGDGVETGDGDGWDADPSDPGDACADVDEDSSWHGTFVTSEIAAQHGGSGIAGQAPGVTILPVRVLGSCGGSESDTVAAIEWASGGDVPGVEVNAAPADVLSMSLGSERRACPTAVQAAVDRALARGVSIVAAAGNEGRPVAASSPANCRGVISVAATTRSGDLARYSNRGTAALAATVAAPGGSASHPVLGDTWSSKGAFDAPGNEAAVGGSTGTSMAAPRVAAAVALLLSVEPGLSPAQVRSRLRSTATAFHKGSSCTTQQCGAGIVNAGDLVGAPARFVRTAPVRITGVARPGRRLVADAGTWFPRPTRTAVRWYRDGTAIAGATGGTYRARPRDVGHELTIEVLVRRGGTVKATATSAVRRVRPAETSAQSAP